MADPGFHSSVDWVKRTAWWLERFGVVEDVLLRQRRAWVEDMELNFRMSRQVEREYDDFREAERKAKENDAGI